MTKAEKLSMWQALYDSMLKIPNEYQSQNHTRHKAEVNIKIYELAQELGYIEEENEEQEEE